MNSNNKVYIIVVNWNGWKDTIECLESILRQDFWPYSVIVCDNGSLDGSLEKIKEWAHGTRTVDISPDQPLHFLSYPPVRKPVSYLELEQNDIGKPHEGKNEQLILIRNRVNLGFAGANNVGIRYALAQSNCQYVWLLNNDTVAMPDALRQMVLRMHQKPDAGMCGSKIPYYDQPSRLWALGGGTYNKWIGKSSNIGFMLSVDQDFDVAIVEKRMDFVAGCSILVSRQFLLDIGLMSEDYFLYFEEPDWSFRANGRYTLAYAAASIVYHKVGMATKTWDTVNKIYGSSMYYMLRNHILFTYRFVPWALPTVLLRVSYLILKRFCLKIIIKKARN